MLGVEDNIVTLILALTIVYIGYVLSKSCKDTDGKIESLLLIIKGIFVTMLSFQSTNGTFAGAIFTIVLAVLAYKYWPIVERKTDLFEIIFLCVEAIVLSKWVEANNIEGIGSLLFVFYEETAIFLLNYWVRCGALLFFKESEDGISSN